MKKPFNFIGFLWITIPIIGIIVIGYGIFKCVAFPESDFIHHWFDNASNGLIVFITSGVFWLFSFGMLTPTYYKKSIKDLNTRWAFKTGTVHTTKVKVFSKTKQSVGLLFMGEIYHISFDFPDGTRKNFSVNVEQFNVTKENETGLLTYKEKENYLFFISFNPQR